MYKKKKRSCLSFHLPTIPFLHQLQFQAAFLNNGILDKLLFASYETELVLSLFLLETPLKASLYPVCIPVV